MIGQAKTPWPLLASLIVVVVGTTLVWQATLGFQAFTWESYRRLNVLQHPVVMPNVQLQDQDGKLFTPAAYKGKLVLVNFIYTRCPGLCTFSGTVYGRLLKALAQDKRKDQVQLLSISLDPEYDTPAHLREYRSRYTRETNTVWRVTRPLPAENGTNLLARFGVISIPDGLGGIKHNAAVHLVDRHGQLVRIMNENDYVKILEAVDRQLKSGQ
jgi:protein SCO1/2